MTTECDNTTSERIQAAPGRERCRSAESQTVRMLIGVVAAVMVFGIVCLGSGMFIIDWLSRYEVRSRDSAQTMPGSALPANPYAAYPGQRETGPALQPNNFYFMMGNQSAYPQAYYNNAPSGFHPPNQAPSMPQEQNLQPMHPSTYYYDQAANQYLMNRQQQDYMEYLRQRQVPENARFSSQPATGRTWAQPGYSAGILVPPRLSEALKKRFSRNAEVEHWLQEETAANGAGENGDLFAGANDPDLDDILRRMAKTTFEDEQYERTARIYAELAEKGSNLSSQELLRWAKAAELSGDKDSSLRILELVLKNDPNNIAILQEVANLLTGSQRFSEAADVYEKLMQLEPHERQWRVNRGKTLTWAGRGNDAVDLLQQLYSEDPNDRELTVMLAELLLSERHYEEALPILDRLIAAEPANQKHQAAKLNALMALQRFREAADLVSTMLEANPGDEDLLLKLAVSLVAAQDFKASLDPFEKYLTLKEEDEDVRRQYADALMAAGSYQEAADQFGMLAKLHPDDVSLLKKQANALMAAQDFQQAGEVYSQLYNELPDDAEVALGFVISLRLSGFIDQALVAASDFICRHPENRDMLIQGAEIANERGNYTLAIRWFRAALRQDNKDYKTRVSLADTLLWAQRYPEAEAELKKALVYHPDDTDVRRKLARSLFHQRRYDESNTLYNQLLAQDSDGAILAEFRYRCALMNRMDTEAATQLAMLKELEPEDITWRVDRHRTRLKMEENFPMG